jgi:phosphomannomutase
MALLKSISGIRGTIGGIAGENLTPIDIVKFTAAYAEIVRQRHTTKYPLRVVIGRDARISGDMLAGLVSNTLLSMGIDVFDTGLSTTPTVEMEVVCQQAHGGIIITASHNPAHWNALKLLNEKGEFFSASEGELVLQLAEQGAFAFAEANRLGHYTLIEDAIDRHIHAITQLKWVDVEAIKQSCFKVAIDCVNSTGGIALPKLLSALGVSQIHGLHCKPNGLFPHNPEPLPEHITDLTTFMKQHQFDMGFVVDPDVDRLAIINEKGDPFGEEYTLVAVADYVLQHTKGNTVSNLSSSQALRIVTEQYGGHYHAAAVGEVHVVEKMKQSHAVIGGEGNGGIIYPPLHYGRDALVGIALFLTHLATCGQTVSQLRSKYPDLHISKNKIELDTAIDTDALFAFINEKYSKQPITTIDGIRIDFDKQWIHLRKSNTEPIIRIYAEGDSKVMADHLAQKIRDDIREYTQQGH